MIDKLIDEFLTLNSSEIKEIKENPTILGGFLALAKKLDSLEKVEKRFYEWSRSLYQATATDESMENLESLFKEFFGLPIKPAGKGLPFKLRLSPSVKQLNGIKNEQALYIKKLKYGEFYAALFPWQRNSDKIEIHLGFSSSKITEGARAQLLTITKKYLSKSAMGQMDLGVGGAIHGIGLPSFLQMSEMEESTFKLKIRSNDRIGYLHVNQGQLIGAESGDLKGRDAAYNIISWENVVIEIENHEPSIKDEIQQPLMHVLMESLKIKDEASDSNESDPFAPSSTADSSGSISPADGIQLSGPSMGPFERIAPPPPIVPKKMSKILLFAVGLAISLPILAVIGLVGHSYLKKVQEETAYQEMMFEVESEINPDIKELQLTKFLDEYNPKRHLTEIEAKMKEIRQQIETRDFEFLTLTIGSLTIDDDYERKAKKLYDDFLSKYPESRYTKEIHAAIAGIKDLIDGTYYQKLKLDEELDMGQRFDAYQDYLKRFPNGNHRGDVEMLLMDMGKQYYAFIKAQAKVCEEKQTWDKCIVLCNNYVKVFENSPQIGAVQKLKTEFIDKQQFNGFRIQTEKLGKDYIAKYDLYKSYLAGHPKSTAKPWIIDITESLKGKVEDQKQWLNLKSYAGNSKENISARLQRVERYIDKNNKGLYSNSARNLYEKLLTENIHVKRNQRQLSTLKKKNNQQKFLTAQSLTISRRIEQVSREFAIRINTDGGRFQADQKNRIFKDSLTGHDWTLLDSTQHLETCLSYDNALKYVKNLNWGGYSDWRLPTSQELAILYKNEPFFPNNHTPWYWTSETYSKGYHNVANIVTSKHEKRFVRRNATQDDCGAVRAVRP
jgi:TolA-binding protein